MEEKAGVKRRREVERNEGGKEKERNGKRGEEIMGIKIRREGGRDLER